MDKVRITKLQKRVLEALNNGAIIELHGVGNQWIVTGLTNVKLHIGVESLRKLLKRGFIQKTPQGYVISDSGRVVIQ